MLRPLAGPGARHIVVVEDDPRLRKMIVTYLNRAGYEVQEAEDGAQGLAAMQTAIPDAVLLDLQMPRMNGVEFLAACRSDPRLATDFAGRQKCRVPVPPRRAVADRDVRPAHGRTGGDPERDRRAGTPATAAS